MANKTKEVVLKAKGRIWIETSEGTLIGKGRVELLEKIQTLGSIRQAAIAMKMSYRQAWQQIDEMNTDAKTPLVISNRGGKGGGNAVITEKGERLIKAFHDFTNKFQQFLSKQSTVFIF